MDDLRRNIVQAAGTQVVGPMGYEPTSRGTNGDFEALTARFSLDSESHS